MLRTWLANRGWFRTVTWVEDGVAFCWTRVHEGTGNLFYHYPNLHVWEDESKVPHTDMIVSEVLLEDAYWHASEKVKELLHEEWLLEYRFYGE